MSYLGKFVIVVGVFLLGFSLAIIPSKMKLELCQRVNNVYECELVAVPKAGKK